MIMNGANAYIKDYLERVISTVSLVDILEVTEAIRILTRARARRGKVFVCGNGGSAATASHFACDLAKGTLREGVEPFRVIALTDNIPLVTAWANDTDYRLVFSRQLEPLISEGDVLVGISGSGNSPNIVEAIETANLRGGVSVAVVGFDGGECRQRAHHSLLVASNNMQHVEDVHMILVHLISSALRDLALSVELEHLLSMDVEL